MSLFGSVIKTMWTEAAAAALRELADGEAAANGEGSLSTRLARKAQQLAQAKARETQSAYQNHSQQAHGGGWADQFRAVAYDTMLEQVRLEQARAKQQQQPAPKPQKAIARQDYVRQGKEARNAGRHEEAASLFLLAVEAGDYDGLAHIGVMFEKGYRGEAPDLEEAASFYRNAAEHGSLLGQYNLAICYKTGESVPKDLREARKWFTLAANQGDQEARAQLAYLDALESTAAAIPALMRSGKAAYDRGDQATAFRQWEQAALAGDAAAMNSLAEMYYNGEHVQQDYTLAAQWWSKAAALGNPDAQYELGMRYQQGRGVKQNAAEAARLWEKAAEGKIRAAQCNIGIAYLNGYGVSSDRAKGIQWLERAGTAGHAKAREILARLRAESEAQRESEQRHAGNLTRKEAMDVLGLAEPFTPEDVKRAHKAIVQKIHPDATGGKTTYMTQLANRARDTLLKG